MTKNEITQAVSGNVSAIGAVVAAIRSASVEDARQLVLDLLAAQATDTATDIVKDLHDADFDEAADFIDDQYN